MASDQQNDMHTEVIYSHKPQESDGAAIISRKGMVVVTENEFREVELPVITPTGAVFTFSESEKTQVVPIPASETHAPTEIPEVIATVGEETSEENATLIIPAKAQVEPATSVLKRNKSRNKSQSKPEPIKNKAVEEIVVESGEAPENPAVQQIAGNAVIETVVNPDPQIAEPATTIGKRRPASEDDARFAPDASTEISLVDIEAVRSEAKFGAPIDVKGFYLKNAARSDYEEQEATLYEFNEDDENISERNSVSSYFPKITPAPIEKAVKEGAAKAVLTTEKTPWTAEEENLRYNLSVETVDSAAVVRRGTLDFGILLLRLLIATLLLFKSLEWLFGINHGVRIPLFAQHISAPAVGFNPHYATILVWSFASLFVITALAIIIGVFTPVVAALALIVELLLMTIHIVDHDRFGFFLDPELTTASAQSIVILAALLAILIFTGPGVYSVDISRGWARRPYIGSILAVILAVIVAAGLWIVLNGHDPLALMHKKK